MMSEQDGGRSVEVTTTGPQPVHPLIKRDRREVLLPRPRDAASRAEALDQLLAKNPRGRVAAGRDLAVFDRMVRETGTQQYCERIGLVRRQVNRMRSGAQPNPVNRLLVAIEAADPDAGRKAIEYICQELGGRFVPISDNPPPPKRSR